MRVTDIKAFVPCKNYQKSIRFYQQIGFHTDYVSDDLTLCTNGDCQLFLQRFYQQELADNFMLQICVENIDEAYARCFESAEKSKISDISQQPWGKVFFLWGPSGELLHMTELE